MKPDRVHDFMPDTALDREIEAILSVEPSPGFVSRVRTRVADATLSGWTMGWSGLAAGSVVVAVVVAGVISNPHEIVQSETTSPVAKVSLRVDTPPDEAPVSPEVNPAKPTPRHRPRVSRAALREPQMLINPEEAAAIRHFLSNPQPARVELSLVTIEPKPLPEFKFATDEAAAIRRFPANPQPERVELSLVTIEPKPLPEFTFTPLPIFNPMSVMQGDYK